MDDNNEGVSVRVTPAHLQDAAINERMMDLETRVESLLNRATQLAGACRAYKDRIAELETANLELTALITGRNPEADPEPPPVPAVKKTPAKKVATKKAPVKRTGR